MTARTAQLIGFTQGCEIRVSWNNNEVLHTTLPAMGTADELAVLGNWSTHPWGEDWSWEIREMSDSSKEIDFILVSCNSSWEKT